MNMKKNIILKEMVPYFMLAPALIIIFFFMSYLFVFLKSGSSSALQSSTAPQLLHRFLHYPTVRSYQLNAGVIADNFI